MGTDETSEIGPLQDRMQYDKVKAMFDEALASGARVLYQDEVPKGPGYFFQIVNVKRT